MKKLTCCRRLNRDTVSKCLFDSTTLMADREGEREDEREIQKKANLWKCQWFWHAHYKWLLLTPFECAIRTQKEPPLAEKDLKHFDIRTKTYFTLCVNFICIMLFYSFVHSLCLNFVWAYITLHTCLVANCVNGNTKIKVKLKWNWFYR